MTKPRLPGTAICAVNVTCSAWTCMPPSNWTWTWCSKPTSRPGGSPRSPLSRRAAPWPPKCSTRTRWLALDPLSEEASRRLMRLHLAQGDATAAGRVYATLRTRLAQELQVQPSAETLALAEHLRTTQARPGSRPTRRPTGESQSPGELVAPLVGRAAALSQLVGSFQQARQGRP